MAINDDNEGTGGNAGKTSMAGAFAEAKPKQQQGQQPSKQAFSFRDLGGFSRSAMSRNPASEVLSKLNKALVELYDEVMDKSFEYQLIPVDMHNTTQLSVSVLILCVRDKLFPAIGVAYHTLIIEGSIEQPVPKFVTINGNNVEIYKTVGEADDMTMKSVVRDIVTKSYSNMPLWECASCVIPRDFNIADAHALHRIASNASLAASSELQIRNSNFVDMNLSNAQQDSNLIVRTTFGNNETSNAVGQPVRSDINIDFTAAPTQNQNQQTVERIANIARVNGFMDMIWAPADVQQSNIFNPQAQANFKRYAARFVITSLESERVLTMNSQLLALVPAFSLAEENKWINAFNRTNFSDAIDIHDIGAIGIEVNFDNSPTKYGKRIDTSKNSFQPQHMHQLVGATFHDGMVLSMDISECGPDTWFNGFLGAAAQGDMGALKAIISSANELTNGCFLRNFDTAQPILFDELNRIHLGHYTVNGVRKDIREIDYLAVLNLAGEKHPELGQDWSDTFNKTQYPLDLRLGARKKIISQLVTDAVFTGFATRVTFTPAFQVAFVKSCREAGLTTRSVDSYTDVGSFDRAGSAYATTSLLSGGTSGLFNRSYGNASGQTFANQSRFAPRWN